MKIPMKTNLLVLLPALPTLLVALLTGTPAFADPLVPLHLLVLEDADGQTRGEVLLLHRPESEEAPVAGVALVETAKGERAELIHYLDTKRGVYVERFEDLGTGWRAERQLDTGMGDLGSADDYSSPSEWVQATGEHRRRLRPVPTYRIETSDGIRIEWQGSPGGEVDAQARAAREEALARLAVELAATPPPSSSLAALNLVAGFLHSDGRELSGVEDLVDDLLRASRAASPSEEAERHELRIRRLPPREAPERVTALKSTDREEGGQAP